MPEEDKPPQKTWRLPNQMVLCDTHIAETHYPIDGHKCEACHQTVKPAETDAPCAMCETFPSPDRVCLACKVALHPQWPAVYCSNTCALDGMYDDDDD